MADDAVDAIAEPCVETLGTLKGRIAENANIYTRIRDAVHCRTGSLGREVTYVEVESALGKVFDEITGKPHIAKIHDLHFFSEDHGKLVFAFNESDSLKTTLRRSRTVAAVQNHDRPASHSFSSVGWSR